ncbi:MAG: HEPN domain-containing protein [Helicobacteraceae bacterium]|nr:HEPN domain-containing protein [Helicobacteraceae bacterium]
MNKIYAQEWLNKAWHHLSSAILLYEAEHYNDIIAVELHYSVEITLKSFLAYKNVKIKKSHDLLEINELVKEYIVIDDFKLLSLITKYHISGAYPPRDRKLPPREEIKEVLDFTQELFIKVCNILDIKLDEVKI